MNVSNGLSNTFWKYGIFAISTSDFAAGQVLLNGYDRRRLVNQTLMIRQPISCRTSAPSLRKSASVKLYFPATCDTPTISTGRGAGIDLSYSSSSLPRYSGGGLGVGGCVSDPRRTPTLAFPR